MEPKDPIALTYRPLTPERWDDFERLFGARGACGGCWCMWWRLKRSAYERSKGEGNRQAMKTIVSGGEVPGLLAYRGSAPVAWCSLGPRERFPVLDRSRTLKRVDDTPVWSVVCFFVAREMRGQGVTAALLRAAVDFARKNGCRMLEAYPVAPLKGRMPSAFAWTGFLSTFQQAGFQEVARRSATRPALRFQIQPSADKVSGPNG